MSSSRQQELASRLQHFNAGDQYEVVDIVGEGAYGVVWYVFQCLFLQTMVDGTKCHHGVYN